MSANNRLAEPGDDTGRIIAVLVLVLSVLVVAAIAYAGFHVGNALAGSIQDVPSDPSVLARAVIDGDVSWPGTPGWIVVVLCATVLLAGLVVVAWWRSKKQVKSSRVDDKAVYMGRGRDIADITLKAATAKAKRLGVPDSAGLPVGVTVFDAQTVTASWEDMLVTIAGPRMGKSTALVIPQILAAPGAVITTSNKRDVVDATRDVRAQVGEVWVFDPQGVANEPATWWWNPLTYVTDEDKAKMLAEHFAEGSRAGDARADAFFDPAGRDLVAGMLLAAAMDGRPITDVYVWLTRPSDEEPAEILRSHDYPLQAAAVLSVVNSPDKQRDGVYGTAKQMVSCLTSRKVAAWVCPTGAADMRPQLDPHTFVGEASTLYSLSKEGAGTAGPLVTALTVAVAEAAEELAARSTGGRLARPLVGVLDEAANVCRWKALPDLYSHFGSRGIVLNTVLQSRVQGEEVWGAKGMEKLWSAANVKIYLGNVSEKRFLEDLSALIGDYDRKTMSTSHSRGGGRTVSTQLTRSRILEVDELAALPRIRAVVFAAACRPTLVRTIPWMVDKRADQVRASIAAHDPSADQSLAAYTAAAHEYARADSTPEADIP